MKIRYTNKFSKDIDSIVHNVKLKKSLLVVLKKLKQTNEFLGRDEWRKKNSRIRGILSDSHR